ncbi:MAG: hypothetical protein IT379_14215, partial [Deltaproteobacteria bacterium]|nr:hypothetical protein [Deltaproteobacteria bacterium]
MTTEARTLRTLVLLAAAVVAPSFAGCYVEESAVVDARAVAYVPPRPVTVMVAPPPPRVEVRPAAPRTGLTWCAGYHDWRGGRWVWVEGNWCEPPRPGRVYDPPTVVVAPGGGYR